MIEEQQHIETAKENGLLNKEVKKNVILVPIHLDLVPLQWYLKGK